MAFPKPVVFHFLADGFQACPGYKLDPVIDSAAPQMVLGVLTGWLARREREAVAYLIEENVLLHENRWNSVSTNVGRMWRRLTFG